MKIADQFLKLIALVVACGFLYLLWERRDIGRFTVHEHGDTVMVVDSKTGAMRTLAYKEGVGAWVEFNPFSGATSAQIVDKNIIIRK